MKMSNWLLIFFYLWQEREKVNYQYMLIFMYWIAFLFIVF